MVNPWWWSITLIIMLMLCLKIYLLQKELIQTRYESQCTIEDLVWKHDSNLALISKNVNKRFQNFEKRNKENAAALKAAAADYAQKESQIKEQAKQMVAKALQYKVWKFNIKKGQENRMHPDRIIVIAESKKDAVLLIRSKFCLDNIEDKYDIVQSNRNKNEILLESYDII